MGPNAVVSAFESVLPHGRYVPDSRHEHLPKLEGQGALLVALLF